MYHALHRDGESASIDAEDLPYAVSESQFLRQLDHLKDKHCALMPGASQIGSTQMPDVIITFDDGHSSNHQIAMPHLLDRGLRAHVFVTTGFIGHRAGFCEPEQVTEMSQRGLLIGAHGTSHLFFDDMSKSQAEKELCEARTCLESWTGTPVRTLSFPGGRFSKQVVQMAGDAGYDRLFGSKFGTLGPSALNVDNVGRVLERVPVRRDTTLREFGLMCEGNKAYFAKSSCRQSIKSSARWLLGNKIYHGLYKSLS